MKRAIYIGIKPQYTKRIVTSEKNYEFRNYYPKQEIDTLYVYESSPTSSLKYIIKLGDIIEYPNKIKEDGYGNVEFNNGLYNYKYAYQIKEVFLLEKPITLKELREKYNFTAPQGYAYDNKYPELTKLLQTASIKKII